MNDQPSIRRGLGYEEALTSILDAWRGHVTPMISVSLADSIGRALGEYITSPVALPPWDNSAMDGYAVRRAEVIGATPDTPRTLRVTGMSVAGSDPSQLPEVAPMCAVRIMTGAPIPPGADAVIRVEDTDSDSPSDPNNATVLVVNDRDAGGRANIRTQGEDVARGATVLTPGTSVRFAHLGLLASTGNARVKVHRAPRVTILSSGDELVLVDDFDLVLSGRRIVSSSSYALPALLGSAGAEVRVAPIVPDTPEAMTSAMEAALAAGCDLLVTTGGISVGAHDCTREAFAALGGTQQFWRARIRPGGPIGSGSVCGTPWIGLPGNPISTLVTAILFAWPLIRVLGGHDKTFPVRIPVRMTEFIDTPGALTHFLRVRITTGAGGFLEAALAGLQGSHLQQSMTLADALVTVPESIVRIEPGMELNAIMLPDAPLLSGMPSESASSDAR